MRLTVIIAIFSLFFLSLMSCHPEKNKISATVHFPIANSVQSNPDSVFIDFEISASIRLHEIELLISSDSLQFDYVAPFNPLSIIPQSTSHHYSGFVDLSSYAPGRKFTLQILTKANKNETNSNFTYFLKEVPFEI
ncbi:hypothetical protein [Aureispira anguillae]|uniref:Lipoprotein n=1 Tax=Aureispira anguillae TaxID=2864201 RepID=A0A915YJI6_9BACT|nr:hypothetical protein [Aureispira anguillae]BDS14258.1 hypothetical protein AsAng_0050370 [Aureispira anguillae]